MRPPAEVYYVDAKFTKDTHSASAGVKGGRVARLEYALVRKAAILGFDPKATVHIYKSITEWIEVVSK